MSRTSSPSFAVVNTSCLVQQQVTGCPVRQSHTCGLMCCMHLVMVELCLYICCGFTCSMLPASSSIVLSCCIVMAACVLVRLDPGNTHQPASDCAPSASDDLGCPAAGGPCWPPWESSLARPPQASHGECTCRVSAHLRSREALCSSAAQKWPKPSHTALLLPAGQPVCCLLLSPQVTVHLVPACSTCFVARCCCTAPLPQAAAVPC